MTRAVSREDVLRLFEAAFAEIGGKPEARAKKIIEALRKSPRSQRLKRQLVELSYSSLLDDPTYKLFGLVADLHDGEIVEQD